MIRNELARLCEHNPVHRRTGRSSDDNGDDDGGGTNSDRSTTDLSTGKELTPLINAILNERRKELFCEGDRWYELKRNGRPEFWVAKQGRKYTTAKFLYTWPLPIDDILLVPGLVQNPGYEKTE